VTDVTNNFHINCGTLLTITVV